MTDKQKRPALQPAVGNPALDQYFTPVWACEQLIQRHFPDLNENSLVVEPSCGTGACLGAVPAHVPAIGVEIDPGLAEIARHNTGRKVLVGDFAEIDLEVEPSDIFGNPPFSTYEIERFIAKARKVLPRGGRMGLILPAYAFQTSSRLARWADDWSILQEALPRDLFPGLSKPLSFLLFSKDDRRHLVGLALYRETAEVKKLARDVQETLSRAVGKPSWKSAMSDVLVKLGGEADLQDIYDALAPKRPTNNQFWKEQVRKVLHESFERVGFARWALPDASRVAA